jgi:fused signal recognition particle receptor
VEPTTIIFIIVALVVLVGAYVIFTRKKAPEIETRAPQRLEAKKVPEGRPKEPKEKPRREELEAAKPSAETPFEAPVGKEPAPSEDEEEIEPTPAPPPQPLSRRKRDVKGLRKGLGKVRSDTGLFGRLKALFGGKTEIDPSLVEEMEEILITSDVGVKTTEMLLADIRERLERSELSDGDAVWSALRERAKEVLDVGGDGPIKNHGTPTVVLMVGVNGTGKTTTIGKLATQLVEQDRKVLLVAGDTFRAAAVAQLEAWGQRVGCEVFAGKEGADPASVVFDAVQKGKDDGVDVILVDTAGRLHTKVNLMAELEKVVKTCDKALAGAPHETLLVLDGTTGQNALQQAQQFGEALALTGIVLTKLDGTAKGGIVLAIAHEHRLPVRYIGVGERARDLRDFDPDEFVEAMLGSGDDAAQAA